MNFPSVAEKVWGESIKLLSRNCVEVMVLRLRPDPKTGHDVCCSRHTHEMKHNLFYVLEGSLTIHEEGREVNLLPGAMYEVLPHVPHRFVVTWPSVVLEITWAESITEDIQRSDVGHVLEKPDAL